jgi:hypothetical protein
MVIWAEHVVRTYEEYEETIGLHRLEGRTPLGKSRREGTSGCGPVAGSSIHGSERSGAAGSGQRVASLRDS